MSPLCLAYYCSGHGFGHATRVSAFARHLLSLDESHTVYIISSAPKHVFATAIALGAIFRKAEIDPIILQPLAYHVDRQKSIRVLESFLSKKEQKVEDEAQWLQEIKADCVLSDAAFLAFLAAHQARIPSVLITNFTFDSIYSLLSISFLEQSPSQHLLADPNNVSHRNDYPEPDTPIPEDTLSPLVEQIFEGYRHADMLLILPGAIPIPSFSASPSLPATQWINPSSRLFEPAVVSHLIQDPHTYTLHPSLPFPPNRADAPPLTKPKQRSAHLAPLLVRPPNDDVYTPEGRSRVLSSLGISKDLHDPATTKILVVSFGGQVIHKPSRSRTPSRPESPNPPQREHEDKLKSNRFTRELSQELELFSKMDGLGTPGQVFRPSHIFVPGAPAPAAMPSPTIPSVNTIPPTPILGDFSPESVSAKQENIDPRSLMLPDASWIAVVCGVADSREWQMRRRNSGTNGEISGEEDNDLPEGFYIAPKYVYMPDLMAVADILLGKLGYGTVAECVDSCTPFVFVSRPLFVEEHGLRLLLEREGVGVEMSQDAYEAGEWASAVSDAWCAGAKRKLERRAGKHAPDRHAQGMKMAKDVITWVNEWVAASSNLTEDLEGRPGGKTAAD